MCEMLTIDFRADMFQQDVTGDFDTVRESANQDGSLNHLA